MGGDATPALNNSYPGGYNLGDYGGALSTAGSASTTFADVANTVATVLGGANNALNAGLAIRDAFRGPKTQTSRISLGSSSPGSLGSPQAINASNLAAGLKVQTPDLGNASVAMSGGPRSPQGGISRAHYDTFLDLMKAYRG